MKLKKHSLFQFSSLDNLQFSDKEYSRLKYGSNSVAKKFGELMAEDFYKKYAYIIVNHELVICESAYRHVRNAASLITESFFNHLNHISQNLKANYAYRLKINRITPYIADYGKLDLKQRKKILNTDTFTFDHDFAKDKFLIFIDDVFISGTHHNKIQEMLSNYDLDEKKCLALYFAEYTGTDGFEIESKLNGSCIKDLNDLKDLISSENINYKIIVRTIKMLLGSDSDNFSSFIQTEKITKSFLSDFYELAIGEGYLSNPQYQKNLEILKYKLNKN